MLGIVWVCLYFPQSVTGRALVSTPTTPRQPAFRPWGMRGQLGFFVRWCDFRHESTR
jgi:hypothetical protein